jgi:hypothetical protein
MSARAAPANERARAEVVRWECSCQQPPKLLGTIDANGTVNIKVRDRYWHVIGQVRTTCPLCGAEHELQNGSAPPASMR